MRYKYRIIKEKNYASYTIEKKRIGLFTRWEYAGFASTALEAKVICKQRIILDREPDKIVIEEFDPSDL